MEKKLEMLQEKYPDLYSKIWWECGDGWYDILDELSQIVQREFDLIKDKDNVPRVVQVKEKFGGLRYYVYGTSDVIEAAIRNAEAKSFRTCEFCGAPGKEGVIGERRIDPKKNNFGWIKTMCDVCEDSYARKRESERGIQ